MGPRPRAAVVALALLGLAVPGPPARGETTPLEKLVVAPATGASANLLDVRIQAGRILGEDAETLQLTGSMAGHIEWDGERITGMAIGDGDLALEDGRFEWLDGFIEFHTAGMHGTPSTTGSAVEIAPDGSFSGQQFVVVFDRGTIHSGQELFDLAEDPWVVTGTANGHIDLEPLAADPLAEGPARPYRLTLRVPIEVEEVFEGVSLPVVGPIEGHILASGTLEATQVVSLPEISVPEVPVASCPFAGPEVDAVDLTELILNWTGADPGGPGVEPGGAGDCNADGRVDALDLTALILAWTGAAAAAEPLRQGASGAQFAIVPVPEPAGGVLAVVLFALAAVGGGAKRIRGLAGNGARHVEDRRIV